MIMHRRCVFNWPERHKMKISIQHTSSFTKIILIGEFLLVAYLLYALALNVYQSYQIDSHIENFEEENRKLTEINRKAAEDLLHYTSNEYLEKIAKQNLGLVNHGEQVIVLSNEVLSSPEEEIFQLQEGQLEKYYHLSNIQRWWKFFFEIDHTNKTAKAVS